MSSLIVILISEFDLFYVCSKALDIRDSFWELFLSFQFGFWALKLIRQAYMGSACTCWAISPGPVEQIFFPPLVFYFCVSHWTGIGQSGTVYCNMWAWTPRASCAVTPASLAKWAAGPVVPAVVLQIEPRASWTLACQAGVLPLSPQIHSQFKNKLS